MYTIVFAPKTLRDILTPQASERVANLAERDVILGAFDEEGHEIILQHIWVGTLILVKKIGINDRLPKQARSIVFVFSYKLSLSSS